jgi:nicotinamidase-related amidase
MMVSNIHLLAEVIAMPTHAMPATAPGRPLRPAAPAELPLPPFYDVAHARRSSYRPDQERLFRDAAAWARSHGIGPSGADRTRVALLLIDLQRDFCFPDGALYVGGRSGEGAIEDNDRIARFVYRNLARLTDVTCTLDTHFPFQIFFASFWVDGAGQPLAPHSVVTTAEIREGRVRPNPAVAAWLCNGNYAWLVRQVAFYTEELERAGKYQLYLWPLHCLLGSDGHALAGVIHEARLFHAFARASRGAIEIKGGNTLTENYSVLAPEVLLRHDDRPLAQRNTAFIRTLLEYDAVIVAGQAASHCVRSSIADLLDSIRAQDEGLVRKVYVLEDCMSAVAVPDAAHAGRFVADFTPQAEAALRDFAAAGMHVVRSTTPMAQWPDFPE